MIVWINPLLWSVFGDRITARVRRTAVHKRNDGNCDKGARPRCAINRNHLIHRPAWDGICLSAAAKKIPVESEIARICQPVVTRCRVSAPAYVRHANLRGELRVEAKTGNPVDIRVDRMVIRRRVNGQHWSRRLRKAYWEEKRQYYRTTDSHVQTYALHEGPGLPP